MNHITNQLKNTTMKQQIENEIKQLSEALKSKLISVNEYCTMYYNLSQKLKSIK